MKNVSFVFILIGSIFLGSCDKENSGDNVLNGSFVAPYVAFSGSNFKISQGIDTLITVRVGTAFQQDLIVKYNVTGAINLPNQTITLPRNSLNVKIPLTIPEGLITTPGGKDTATIALTSGTLMDGTVLRVGVQGNVVKEVLGITIRE